MGQGSKFNVKLPHNMSAIHLTMLVILRIVIGWHFLYEGVSKLYTPDWTSEGYLTVSKWIFSGFFHWIASNPLVLKAVDLLNIWGLILIGLGLMFGCFTRIASISGIVLLSLYYFANPPFIGMDFGIITEGNYLIVDKNLVELFALVVLVFIPTGTFIGLDRYINLVRKKLPESGIESTVPPEQSILEKPPSNPLLDRREILKSLATMPVFGAFVFFVLQKAGWDSYEEKQLKENVDAVSRATNKTFDFSSLKDLKGQVPQGHIKNLNLSRVILGGNLIGGWAHARDLIYVSKLVKAYHSRTKIFETFLLAEKCGINAFLTNPVLCAIINEYWRRDIGKIQFISDCGGKNLLDGVRKSIDNGANACYVHGGIADNLAREGKIEQIAQAVELIKQNNRPAGIGGHAFDTVKKCVDYGIEPDFWMKTLHSIEYWSARPEEVEHGLGRSDNLWCANPQETVAYMKSLRQPWIAFKTLAAGAIHPKEGFQYAFSSGADFICVGMYDFQIVEDVNIALDVLSGDLQRIRPWIA